MEIFPLEVWGYLIEFIDDNKDKCRLLMTCKEISNCAFYFYDEIHIEKINKSVWFNQFTNIFVWNTHDKLPTSIKKIRFWRELNVSVDDYIPSTITHLKFGNEFNKPIKKLPPSLIKLSFGNYFNQPIKGLLSPTLTQLKLGKYFKNFELGTIPSTVTHLTLGCKMNNFVPGYIPTSVTHIKINYFDRDYVKCLPNSITHLTFNRRYTNFVNVFYNLICPPHSTSLTNIYFRDLYSKPEKDLIQGIVLGSKITVTFYKKNDQFDYY